MWWQWASGSWEDGAASKGAPGHAATRVTAGWQCKGGFLVVRMVCSTRRAICHWCSLVTASLGAKCPSVATCSVDGGDSACLERAPCSRLPSPSSAHLLLGLPHRAPPSSPHGPSVWPWALLSMSVSALGSKGLVSRASLPTGGRCAWCGGHKGCSIRSEMVGVSPLSCDLS